MAELHKEKSPISKADTPKEYQHRYQALEDEEVEQFEEEYRIFFDSPSQLVDVLNKLEEGNLQVIQVIQENEQLLIDLSKKLSAFDSEKNAKIAALTATRDDLRMRIRHVEEETRSMQRLAENVENEDCNNDMKKVRAQLLQIYQTFRGDFEKPHSSDSLKDMDEKRSLMTCLSLIEGVIYKYSLAIRKEDPAAVYKLVG